MKPRIYFCGEVVADLLERNGGSNNFDLLLGGSQFHGSMGAAKAVKRNKLEVAISFVGQISEDTFGDRFISAFLQNGVDTGSIKRTPRNTTLAIVVIEPGKENRYSFYGRETAEAAIHPLDLPKILPQTERKICCFGSVSTVMEPAGTTWLGFAREQVKTGPVYYDLNTRPALIRDRAEYQKRVAEWAATVSIVKASDADIAWTYPNLTAYEVAKLWLDCGAKMAVITQGAQGALAFTKQHKIEIYETPLLAPNTVGAGDNFNAGVALGLIAENKFTHADLDGLSAAQVEKIIRSGNQTAAAHLIGLGAKPSAQSAA
jgi:fructokinase